MQIVDAQIHIWGAETPERPWPKGSEPHRTVPPSAEGLLKEMDLAGADRAILVPAKCEQYRNDLALAAASAHPDRFAVMGRFDAVSMSSRGKLASWRAQKGMLGLRLAFNGPDLLRPLTEGRVDWVWAELEKADVPVYIMATHSIANIIDAIAARHAGLRIVMDHLALETGQKDDSAFANFAGVLAMAKRPNVAVKVSALPCYTTEEYPYRNLHKYLRLTYDAFGPKRMFWGSDLTRLPCTYRQCVTMFTEEMPWLSKEDLDWIMGRGLCEWLGWQQQQH